MKNNHSIFWEILALGLLILAVSFIAVPMLDSTLMSKEPNEIIIRLSVVEAGGYDPDVIIVKKGEPVKLILIGMDVVHGFAIESLGVDAGVIHPGEQVSIEFTPEEEGEFEFTCTVICSSSHPLMSGKIVVEE